MKIYGQLESAQLEVLGTDPTQAVQGRIYFNTTTGRSVLDDGTNKRALLRNDGKAVFGSDATAANNVRFHHAGVGILQFVTGDDTTAENAMSSSLAQVGLRTVNLAAAPTAGNIGRLIYNTTTQGVMVDNGSAFLQFATLTGAETLTNKTLTGPIVDAVVHPDLASAPSAPASGFTKIYTRGGTPYKLASDGVETVIGAAGNVVTTVSKSAAYTATANDGFSFNNAASAGYTITLPAASASAGVRLTFMKTDATFNVVTIGAVTTLNTQNEQVTILSNGSAWFVVDRNIPSAWTVYTLNIGATTTAPTKPTTRVVDIARWRRNAADIEIVYALRVSSSAGATTGSGIYLYPAPSGLPAFDTANIPAYDNTASAAVGWMRFQDNTNTMIGQSVIYNSTNLALTGKYNTSNQTTGAGVGDSFIRDNVFSLTNGGFPWTLSFYAKVPVTGWNT